MREPAAASHFGRVCAGRITKIMSSFRDGPKDQTSDVQLHIGESLDSGFAASRRPGTTWFEQL